MDLKALGLRFALGYLMSRAKGESKENSAVDSLLGSTIAQAGEDISGFTPEMADVTTKVVADVVQGRRARKTANLSPLKATELDIRHEIEEINNPEVGLTENEIVDEVACLQAGIDEAVDAIRKLEKLKAGVIKRD